MQPEFIADPVLPDRIRRIGTLLMIETMATRWMAEVESIPLPALAPVSGAGMEQLSMCFTEWVGPAGSSRRTDGHA